MAATAERRGWFARRAPRQPQLRVLTAAATRLDLTDKREAQRQRKLREGWQLSAWGYRDSIPELRYAVEFLANCSSRMRLFPAGYPVGGESDNPVPLADIPGCPPGLADAAGAAINDLGNGRMAISGKLHSLSTNLSIAGEGWLLGQQDPRTGAETWTIRSVGEIIVKEDKYYLREVPGESQGVFGNIELDEDTTLISRIWRPHPQWRLLADSPLRSMMDTCDALMILRRMIRATGRSRLAGAGIVGIPEELQIKRPSDDNEDPEADDFMGEFVKAMLEPIADEGAASVCRSDRSARSRRAPEEHRAHRDGRHVR